MRLTFYGVRGSIPAPGPHTAKYGGNTACVHVELKNGKHVVLDAGTGIRDLGEKIADTQEPIYILQTHSHWDHIQGFPFFLPVHQSNRKIYIFSSAVETNARLCSMLDQLDGVNFPVKAEDLPSVVEWVLDDIEAACERHGIQVSLKPLNHPAGGSAYRIEEDGVSCVYATDNELVPPGKPRTSFEEWVNYCREADVLIHDAQYLDSEMPHKHGWGHSAVSQVWQLALSAQVKTLVLFHHDPLRTDSELDEIQVQSEAFFRAHKAQTRVLCSWEGLVIEI